MAAALKGYQSATGPVAGTGLLDSRWFVIGVVEFELFFGLWLLSGLLPRQTRAAAIVCFGGFACVSLYKALSGEASCGCVGRVQVNPWYTFTLDVAAVAALVRWRPQLPPSPSGRGGGGEGSIASVAPTSRKAAGERRRPALRLIAVLILWLLAGVPAGGTMGSHETASISDIGEIIGDGPTVLVRPEKWIGKRLPILAQIDIGERLTRGKWIVILLRNDCARCRSLLPTVSDTLSRAPWSYSYGNTAAVDLANSEPGPATIPTSYTLGKVAANEGVYLFAEIPVCICLREGIVSEVHSL